MRPPLLVVSRLGRYFQKNSRLFVALALLVLIALAGIQAWASAPAPIPVPGAPTATSAPASEATASFKYFSFLTDNKFSTGERAALFGSLVVALLALAYAGMLVKQVVNADQGTKKMQEIAAAVREGANAYLSRQLRVVGALIVVLVVVLFFSKYDGTGGFNTHYAIGRAWAFLMGAVFSATVGLVGMRMATIGNLRVASAAPVGFGRALMFGYRSGTITGMMTDATTLLLDLILGKEPALPPVSVPTLIVRQSSGPAPSV